MLKGGTGLIVRNPDARYSQDVDLYYAAADHQLAAAASELRTLAAREINGDFLTFTVGAPKRGGGQGPDHVVAQLKVTPYIGVSEYGGVFPIDLSLNQRVAKPVDLVSPQPIVDLPGVEPLPTFVLYPLPEQIADKLCAMYSRYSGSPSSRYRDLVDLVFIITSHEFDAARTVEAVRGEVRRRQFELPIELTSPGPQWEAGYRTAAQETSLPDDLVTLAAALRIVGDCLHPLLTDRRTSGTWIPSQARWA